MAESVGAMARLVERGLTRYIGLSEASANSIRCAVAEGSLDAWLDDPDALELDQHVEADLVRGDLDNLFSDSIVAIDAKTGQRISPIQSPSDW